MSIAVFTPGPQKLEAARLSDRLAALIERQIDGGALVAGDRLPTEQQLAEAHGVSRTVVREAVHQLKSQGLVRSRQGSGVFITEPPAHRALAFDPKVLESMNAVLQMVELRRVIEGEMAALAAQRATRMQLAGIRRALLAIDEATERGELGVEQDMGFHRAVGEATGNPQFVRLLGILEAYLRDAMTVTKGHDRSRRLHGAGAARAPRDPGRDRRGQRQGRARRGDRTPLERRAAIDPGGCDQTVAHESQTLMPEFSANLSMLYNGMPFSTASAPLPPMDSRPSNLFPPASRGRTRRAAASARPAAGAVQRPAGRGPPASVAWPACPAARTNKARRRACARLRARPALPAHPPDGRPAPAGAKRGALYAAYVANLAWAAAQARDVNFLIEPIDTRDIPGFFLNRQDEAHAVVAAVGAPNLKVQMDLYHCQIVEGDLGKKI